MRVWDRRDNKCASGVFPPMRNDSLRASSLPTPDARTHTSLAAASTWNVRLKRCGGGFGPITGITQREEETTDSGAPGKSEAT